MGLGREVRLMAGSTQRWLAEEDRKQGKKRGEKEERKGRSAEGGLSSDEEQRNRRERPGWTYSPGIFSWFRYDSNLFCFSRFELFSSVPSQCVDSFDI